MVIKEPSHRLFMQFYETVYACHFTLISLMTVIGIIFLKYPSKVSLFSVIEFFLSFDISFLIA